MIETTQAIENLEEIATTPGVDGFYIGPSDLAITMGLVPKLDHDAPQHIEAVQKIVDTREEAQPDGRHPHDRARGSAPPLQAGLQPLPAGL